MRASVTLISGSLVVVLVATGATIDIVRVARSWEDLGPLRPGSPVPTFRISTVEGATFATHQLLGKVSVLTFWASWCGVCSTEMPMFAELHRERRHDPDVQVVLVNREGGGVSVERARRIAAQTREQRGLDVAMAVDDGSLYGAVRGNVLPHTIIVDREGVVRFVHEGRVARSTLDEEVDRLLAE